MKCPSVTRWAMATAAVAAWLSAQAGAADLDQISPSEYGYGQPSYGQPSYGQAGFGSANPGYGTAGYAPAASYGAASLTSYPGYGYAANNYGYPGYGYGGYAGYGMGGYGYGNYGSCGTGGCGAGGHRHCGRRRHCTFSANATCCQNAWDGYCDSCGPPVKVHRRHRALGCGAGPCVDANCGCLSSGYVTNCGHVHRCHLRRNRFMAACGMGCGSDFGCNGGGGMIMDQSQQPGMNGPAPSESLQAPTPMPDEPPSPGDAPST